MDVWNLGIYESAAEARAYGVMALGCTTGAVYRSGGYHYMFDRCDPHHSVVYYYSKDKNGWVLDEQWCEDVDDRVTLCYRPCANGKIQRGETWHL